MTDSRREVGDDHPDTLRTRNNLVGAYRWAGRLKEAIGEYQAAWTSAKKALSPTDEVYRTIRANLVAAMTTTRGRRTHNH